MPHTLTVGFRVDIGCRCTIGIGKIELLEGKVLPLAGSGLRGAGRPAGATRSVKGNHLASLRRGTPAD